jgi:hypothetical protein
MQANKFKIPIPLLIDILTVIIIFTPTLLLFGPNKVSMLAAGKAFVLSYFYIVLKNYFERKLSIILYILVLIIPYTLKAISNDSVYFYACILGLITIFKYKKQKLIQYALISTAVVI